MRDFASAVLRRHRIRKLDVKTLMTGGRPWPSCFHSRSAFMLIQNATGMGMASLFGALNPGPA